MAEHPRSARHVGVLHSAGILRGPRTSPSHGENRGSSPLGSANDFKQFSPLYTSRPLSYVKYTERMLLNFNVRVRTTPDGSTTLN